MVDVPAFDRLGQLSLAKAAGYHRVKRELLRDSVLQAR